MVASMGTQLELADGVAWITLDDGKVNALSAERIAELGRALDAAGRARAVTVVRGREGILSAGQFVRGKVRHLLTCVWQPGSHSRQRSRVAAN